MSRVLTKGAPEERHFRLTSGPSTRWEEQTVHCSAFPPRVPCTRVPFAIQSALSMPGKRSTRFPEN